MPSFFVCQGTSTASQTLLHMRHMNFNELILLQCTRQGSVNISALQRSARGQKRQLQKIRKVKLTLLELC